jgi:hypothetical protein
VCDTHPLDLTIGELFPRTATGVGALLSNTTGFRNTATGAFALLNNLGAADNTATGNAALYANTTGSGNTATGNFALAANTAGSNDTAIGNGALGNNLTDENTAVGAAALANNTTGTTNTAVGFNALANMTTAGDNTAIGHQALVNSTSFSNTAIGARALSGATTGGGNIAIGVEALSLNTTGETNIAIGFFAGTAVTTASNVISIGTGAAENVSNSCFIGNIWNQPGGSQAVYVNSEGKLGAMVSSRCFKDDIEPMDRASEVIYGLQPVSFRYKAEIEPTRPLSFGLIAEDVEKISPYLVTRDGDGKVNSVRYDQVNAMLLNEFLKEQRKVQKLEAALTQQEERIEALAVGLQKVSAQVETAKPVRQIVVSNR